MNELTVYLNQQYLPQSEAKISIFDRGVLFGDSIYEVIPFFSGKPMGFVEHIERLNSSLAQLHMQPPYSNQEWLDICHNLIERNPQLGEEQGIYLQVTRGEQNKRDHHIPAQYQPNVFAFPLKIPQRSDTEINAGYTAITTKDLRHFLCNVKSNDLLANILAIHKADQVEADEAILVRDGNAMEFASSNLFIVKDNQLITPRATELILNGITRQFIIRLAKDNNIDVIERNIPLTELYSANEVWMTSSMKKALPIVEVDGRSIADGKPGVMWQRMYPLVSGE